MQLLLGHKQPSRVGNVSHLLTGEFEWVDPNMYVFTIPDSPGIGYVLEMGLKYPQHLPDKHRDLPFWLVHNRPAGS